VIFCVCVLFPAPEVVVRASVPALRGLPPRAYRRSFELLVSTWPHCAPVRVLFRSTGMGAGWAKAGASVRSGELLEGGWQRRLVSV